MSCPESGLLWVLCRSTVATLQTVVVHVSFVCFITFHLWQISSSFPSLVSLLRYLGLN